MRKLLTRNAKVVFKNIYGNKEFAKDILRLALPKEELELFDLDNISVYKELTANADTGKEGVGDLHFKLSLKEYPHLHVHFSVFLNTRQLMPKRQSNS